MQLERVRRANGNGRHDEVVAAMESDLEELNEVKVILDIEMSENLIAIDELESEMINATNTLRVSLRYLEVETYIYIYIYINMTFIYFLAPERYKKFYVLFHHKNENYFLTKRFSRTLVGFWKWAVWYFQKRAWGYRPT